MVADQMVCLWSGSGDRMATFKGYTEPVRSLAVPIHGDAFVSACNDGQVRSPLSQPRAHASPALSGYPIFKGFSWPSLKVIRIRYIRFGAAQNCWRLVGRIMQQ